MHKLLTTLTFLTTTLFTLPTSADVAGRPAPAIYTLEGSCGTTDSALAYPKEDAYIFALNAYCDTFVQFNRNLTITDKAPLMVTYDLALGNGKRGPFVLETMCQYPGHPPYMAQCVIDHDKCVQKFSAFLDDEKVGVGKDVLCQG